MAAPKIEKLLTPYNFTNKDNAGRIKYIVIHYVDDRVEVDLARRLPEMALRLCKY